MPFVRAIIPAAIVGLCVSAPAYAATPGSFEAALNSITRKDLKRHVGYLASDAFEGREAGTRGGRMASLYITSQFKRFKSLRPGGDKNSYTQRFDFNFRNILVLLPGRDTTLKREYVVVCAHYDHVGYGTRRNSQGPVGYIHNGADDNASGTAGVLEVIEAFATLERRPRRSVLFVFWDAEEKGLLGSEHWVKHPTVPREKVRLMLNVDMIGRLRNGRIEVHGCRGAFGMRRFLSEHSANRALHLQFGWDLPRESDHYPFLQAAIPAIMLHTGKHADYHRPSDDAHKLNFSGLQSLSRLTFRLAYAAANAERLPRYRAACFGEAETDRRRKFAALPPLPPRLGLAWDATRSRRGNIRVVSVASGGPAQQGGVKPGDRVLRFAGVRVRNSGHFRRLVMGAVNPVPIVVQRDGRNQPLTLRVRLRGQARRVGVSWEEDDGEPGSVVLRRVIADSPAALAGLQVGDRVYAVDGKPFKTEREFRDALAAEKDTLRLRVERHGWIRDATMSLSPSPPVAAARPE
ncbi:MAG: M20/M25/M40 family metallo-hydrolase [Planctomycetaceae bacterium]